MLHQLKASPQTVHWGYYDWRLKPVLKVQSGDTIEIESVSGEPAILERHGLDPNDIPDNLRQINSELKRELGPHILTGPIYIEGAHPGDVLEIKFIDIVPSTNFGYNTFMPGRGSIPQDFPYARHRIIRFDSVSGTAELQKGLSVPLRPFFGSVGVAPPDWYSRMSSIPPGFHGGNMDNKELVAGTRVFLPVHVEGALLSAGDGHGAQGDGEVNVTAIETSLKGTVEVHVRKDLSPIWPLADTPTHVISMGFDEDLDQAARMALRNMIDYLVRFRGLHKDDAYVLCSLALDLRVTQIVNIVKGVHGMMSKDIIKNLPEKLVL